MTDNDTVRVLAKLDLANSQIQELRVQVAYLCSAVAMVCQREYGEVPAVRHLLRIDGPVSVEWRNGHPGPTRGWVDGATGEVRSGLVPAESPYSEPTVVVEAFQSEVVCPPL